MDIRRLRILTIVGPLAFLVVLEIFGIFFLRPSLGDNSLARLLIIFGVLTVAIGPFSFWVFGTIERQQRELAKAASVLETVSDYAIFMMQLDGIITTWSPGAEKVKGYRPEEIVGRHFSQFYTNEDREAKVPQSVLDRVWREGHADVEGWRVRKDGSRFWANVVATAVRDQKGEPIGVTLVVRDITERREAEERIRHLNAELEGRISDLAQANEAVARHNRELNAINMAITSISTALNLSDVLQNIADAARDLVHSRYAALGVADDKGKILQFITSGISVEEREAIGPLPEGHGLLGALIKDARPLRISDIGKDPRRHGFPANHPPMKSLLGVPILLHGHAVGDLYLTDKIGADAFNSEDQDLLILLANHAAVAIENARLYEEARLSRDRLQAWNAELEELVAQRTAEIERSSKEITTRVLHAQEEERKRIARELHDDTAQSLSSILITLDLLEPELRGSSPAVWESFERVRGLTKHTLDETRALSHDLRPTILDDFGLAAALRWYAEEFTTTFGTPVDVRIAKMPFERVPAQVELALFRIAQEALTNVGKYADATQVKLRLWFPSNRAQLLVEDDGRGFDAPSLARPSRESGLGLYGMKERADLIGAHLEIDAEPGRGTHIIVTTRPLIGIDKVTPVAAREGERS